MSQRTVKQLKFNTLFVYFTGDKRKSKCSRKTSSVASLLEEIDNLSQQFMPTRKGPKKSSYAAQVFKFGSASSKTSKRDVHSPRPTSMYKQRHVDQTGVNVLESFKQMVSLLYLRS